MPAPSAPASLVLTAGGLRADRVPPRLAVTSCATAIAACFAAIAAGVPWVLVHSRARRRRTELREVWPEVVDNLASGVRAGLSLPEALIALAERGPEELRAAFRRFAEDYRATGRFEDASTG